MRTAVIGLGEAGAGIHVPALRRLTGVRLVAGCDPDPARRARLPPNIPAFDHHTAMLEAAAPDLVVVASPPAFHAAHCLAALDAGAHVLCEKPFTATVREGQSVLARAAAVGRRVAINHEFRAMPAFRALIRAVRAAGGPAVVQAWQLVDRSPASDAGWRGGLRHRTLYEAGVHLVDIILQLFGEAPHTVHATISACGEAGPAEDTVALVTFRFSRGRLAQLIQSRVHRGDRQYLEVRADVEGASYRASFGGRARLAAGLLRSPRPSLAVEWGASGIAWREQGTQRSIIARNGGTPLVTATRSVVAAVAAALRSGAEMPYSAEDGLATLRVVAAAYHAARAGAIMALDGPESAAYLDLSLGEAGA